MSQQCSRRCFLLSAAATGGGFWLAPNLAAADCSDEDMAALRSELAIAHQTREVDFRMRLFDRLIAKYGSDLVDDVRTHTIEETKAQFEDERFNQRDLAGVKQILWDGLGDGFDFECVEDTPTRLSFKVNRCFLAEAAAKHEMPALGYAFYCAWDEGFCKGLNPKIAFTRTKVLMLGDDCCNHTYELAEKDKG